MTTRLIAIALLAACGSEPATPEPIRFLHTFSAAETELFNRAVRERGLAVESSLVPFARGQQVIGEILAAGQRCPDLIRIDATWLPGLHARLVAAPPELTGLDWTPEAAALAQHAGTWWGVPQAVDGLLVVRDAGTPAPRGAALDEVLASARAARDAKRPFPLGLRVDGYWFVPWLRAEGADLAAGAIDGDGAVRAFARFAALFGELGEPSRVAVSALAGAPRGGQLLVVPACAPRPAQGWRLASELASVPFATALAQAFSTIPTRTAVLAAAPPLSRAAYEALRGAGPLPRDAVTPLLFDDLNPALAAVVARDATPEEAVAGVRRGWRRLMGAPE